MNIAQFSIKRPVVTMMIVISMVILGIMTLLNLKTQLLPNYNIPTVTIRTSWRGASPDDMEKLVTREIENGITKVEGIRRVSTNSTMGKGTVTVEFEFGTDVDAKVNDITTAISRIRNNLPDDMDEPWVSKAGAFSDRVMMFSITGENLVELKSFADNILIPRIEKIEGVGEISIFGGFERQVLISLDPNKIEAYGLDISELYQILKKSSLNFPAGYVREGDKEYLVRVYGETKTLEDIKEIVVKNINGNTIYLTDVADIELSIKDMTSYGRTNGEDNVIVSVEKTDNGNAIYISEEVKKELNRLEPLLPVGAKFNINRDSSIDIINSIDSVKNGAILGLFLATIVLYVFLKDIRATFIVFVSIPVSVIATFGFFGAKGMTLNIISLMGLSLGIGMLVDNSIVVIDNIFRHLTEYKEDSMVAAEKGATEVIVPIIASTATTIAVFLPVVLREGRAKEMYQDLSYSITFSLLASLIIAVTFVPMMASKILRKKDADHEDGRVLKFIRKHYISILEKCLRRKTILITSMIGLFLLVVVYGGSKIGGEFVPTTDDGVYTIVGEVPSGLDIEKVNRISKIFEKAAEEDKYTKQYMTSVRNNSISVIVDIGQRGERDKTVFQIIPQIRKKLVDTPDVKLNVVPKMTWGRGGNRDITLILKSDDVNQLDYFSRQIENEMSKTDGFVDIANSMLSGNPESRIILDRKRLEYYGINVNDLTFAVSYQILGGTPIKIKTGTEELDVVLQLDKKYRDTLDGLMDARIKNREGQSIKLRDIANLEVAEGAYGIEKENRIRTVSINANTSGNMDLVTGQRKISEIIEEINLPRSVEYSFGGQGRNLQEVNTQLQFAFVISIFLIYFILAAQFESYILPFIVMGTVPLSIIGVYIGLFITGEKTNTMVFVGIIMLAGIVVNNAIVLIDYIKILLEKGNNLFDAIIKSGETRLRPILMTTMTTVFGMVPLALGMGQGSETYKGMAIAVISGLIFSTMLTLVLIPVLFYIYCSIKKDKTNL